MHESEKPDRKEMEYENLREYETRSEDDLLPEWISSLKNYFMKVYESR